MKKYEIELAHGPVIFTRHLGGDKVRYILEDGRVYDIEFSKVGHTFYSDIVDDYGNRYHDMDEDFEGPTEGDEYTTEDYAQFIADNFEWIEELIEGREPEDPGNEKNFEGGWHLAKRICCDNLPDSLSDVALAEIFGTCDYAEIMNRYTATEAEAMVAIYEAEN